MDKAPLFDDIAQGPANGSAWWLTCSDGVKIRMGHWPATGSAPARGTVLLFPGRTEYVEKYGPAAAEFTGAGYDMISIDWRGQGIADRVAPDRLLGHVDEFDHYQADLAAVMEAVRELDLPKPYYLIGHSMGGCIGLRALHEGLPVNAAVFSAPMWGIGMSLMLRPIAWSLSWFTHSYGNGTRLAPATKREGYVQISPFEDNQLTRDPEMWDFMVRQLKAQPDLALGGPSVTWLYHALRETAELERMAPPTTPTLTFLGTNERIVATPPVHKIMGGWTNGTLVMVKDAEHEIMMEVPESRTMFFKRTVEHFSAHP
ncbi:alpha/beta hydrolase [Maritimibacter sp. UBA3975]|uniref:alpha/beta fold hydrolase n=1 Tax=Maritimibacter sp. UBA3975 TaxID=1946833 RepID=UPI000C0AA7CD|nr:alpha/beta hydrolase [Maritimibacter sp. UBA3975]MAM61039.1 lysophospholipase [Maritimibacter sp.]|tara:strand:- start:7 stop:951 length:945 start_codon:yes stop_codon:yes gene_type:complete